MRFMSLYKPGSEQAGPPNPEHMAAMGALIEDMAKSGVLLSTDGLHSSSKGARIRAENGKFTVTDGPFAEAKELIGGYAIMRVNSKEEAIEHTKRFLSVVGRGECELRQMDDEAGYDANARP